MGTSAQIPGSTAANGKIAFDSYEGGDADIYAIDPDGTGKINLTDEAPDAYSSVDVEPTFSPDGTQIAFQSDRNGDQLFDVWVVSADGSGQPRRITTAEGHAPTWSPDGTQIAYSSPRDGNSEIWVENVDGSGTPRQITHTGNQGEWIFNFTPSWSVDGKIAYVSNKDNPGFPQRTVYVVNADGTGEPTRLTNTPTSSNWAPEWSPDGKRIAFWGEEYPGATCGPCDRDVYVMDAVDSDGDGNGDNQINVTNDPAVDYQPNWSPDGTQISFVRFRYIEGVNEYSLWTVPAPQTASSPTPGVALLGAFSAKVASAQESTSGPTPVANSSGARSSDWAPNTPPKIWGKSLLPADGITTTDRTPAIGAKVTDAETELTKRNVALLLDGAKVDRTRLVYNPDTKRVRYIPRTDLSAGEHTVRVIARDPQGSVARKSWHFSVALP